MSFRIALPFVAALLAFNAAASAFEISNPASDKYWVACSNNTLSWTSNSTDPESFAVTLIDTSNSPTTPSLVNGNYQIANGLQTSAGSAIVELNCVTAASTYQILFVNASQYELEHPQVFFYGESFEIKPNGTAPAPASTTSSSGISADGMTTSIVSNGALTSPTSTNTPSSSTKASGAAAQLGGATAAVILGVVAGVAALL
ncbi:hypothetical protein CF319_g4982 [Tilletia indica]|uniref:Yeast cell wall synthesis Kre9/Knh1-like N-terminal domain-containing protein n=2 Tax=Tilletia TaxID=13289 RepID=A0A8X7N3C7_9BASI|nr:hypothetical protein CF327_g3916 [Tilletia walkeri]KAE8221699.1 hypothetical protein CF319_g4982 [Tilletia indica]KAE8230421.1 hypothetical protein CF326_g4581 [Tilletia indica]KAE8258860.1 hypothetical protein A4X13_0g1385 [Tilletia indica]KAE8266266.1 hypothetical protein A4X09_0g6081 [Tilletia walkeri]